jgi:hypothetical protein
LIRSGLRPLSAGVLAVVVLAGCGLAVQAPDLFQVTRSGAGGQRLTLLVNDGGTISCDGGKPRSLPDPQLLQARDLATSLNADVNSKLRFPVNGRSVFSYTVKVQNGTFSFPDTAANTRKELSQLELFVLQAAASPCGLAP